jgi:hypothetical protein
VNVLKLSSIQQIHSHDSPCPARGNIPRPSPSPLRTLDTHFKIQTLHHRDWRRNLVQCRHTCTHFPSSPAILTWQDFRSQDGLYNLVKERYPKAVVKGKDLFDISLFSSPTTTSVFYTFIASLRNSVLSAHPTPTHKFIRTMHEQGKLVRCYTQNIDGIETREGLSIGGKEAQVCQLHGDIHTLRCDYCNVVQEYTSEWTDLLLDGEAPDCPECVRKCTLQNPIYG